MAATTSHSAYGSDLAALTTALNSLASAGSVTTAAITANTKLFVDCYVKLNTQGSARAADARVDIYLLGSPDAGTTYVDFIENVSPQIGSIKFDAATTAQTEAAHDCPIPPGHCKLVFVNRTGQAFAATANVAWAMPHNVESN